MADEERREEESRVGEETLFEEEALEEAAKAASEVGRSDGGRFWQTAGAVVGVIALGFAAMALLLGGRNGDQIADIREKLAAKADRSEVVKVRSAVGTLVSVTDTLNGRVVRVEENLRKNREAVAAASKASREAKKFTQTVMDQLDELSKESEFRWASSERSLDTLKSRFNNWARASETMVADLRFHADQQEGVVAEHDSLLALFRLKLRLSDRDMAKLAAKLKKIKGESMAKR